jgi:hypothetical protein
MASEMNLSAEEEELERLMLVGNSQFNQVLEAAEQQIQETGSIRHDEFWKLLEQE